MYGHMNVKKRMEKSSIFVAGPYYIVCFVSITDDSS